MRLKRAPSDVRPTRHRRLVIWLGVFTLLLSLLTPLVSVQAADAAENLAKLAQGVPPDCEEGYEPDATGTECVLIQQNGETELQPEQTEQIDCGPDATLNTQTGECVPNQPTCDPGSTYNEQTQQCEPDTLPVTINLYKYECPPDAADYQQDYGQLNMNCFTPTVPYTMSHTGPDGGVDGPVQVQGQMQWPNEAPGSHSITEQVPEGYTLSVWCTVYDPNSVPSQPQPYTPDGSGSVYLDVQSGWWADCYWFNIPPETGGTVTVYKWECAPGTEFGRELDYYQGGLPDQDIGPCETEHGGLPIALADGRPDSPHEATTDHNEASWDGVVLDANGSIQVTVTDPPGYGDPMVFCGTLDEQTQSPVTATNGGITLTPPTQPFDYQCNWYNIPVPPYAQILIEKYWCDEGYAPAEDATQSDIMSSGSCQATGPQTTFSLAGPGGPYEDMTVDGTPGDTVTWPLTEGGDYTVTEAVPDGYALRVYCHTSPLQTNGTGNGLADPQPWEVLNGNSIQWTAEEGYYWICAIFNIPADYNYIDFYKYVCDTAAPEGSDKSWYEQNCPLYNGGVDFDIEYPDGSKVLTRTNNDGYANWSGVGTGAWTATEFIPDGYGDPVVFCRYVEWPDEAGVTGDWAPYEAPGGILGASFDYDGMRIECHWYNIPTDGNSVTVYKWQCEPGTESGRELDYYQGGLPDQDTGPCETEHGGLPIALADGRPDSPHEATTDHNEASWDGVVLDANGSIQVTVTDPPGYGDPMVFCGTLDEEGQSPVTATGGTISLTPSGEPFDYQCNWYNIPTDEYNYVDLYKYECLTAAPEGADQSWYEQNCTPVTGWNFNVGYEGGGSSQATGENGQASWSGVPAGTWSMSETVPEGYGEPVIWCRYVEWPDTSDETGEWTMYTPQEGYFESNFEDGNWRIECYWYNFPGELDPFAGDSKIIIYKYWCTGDAMAPDLALYQEACTETMDGVSFTVTGEGYNSPKVTTGGVAEWEGLATGQPYTIQESVPPGYGEPVIWCGYTYQDGVEIDPQYDPYQPSSGGIQVTLENGPAWLVCHWYNFPGDENTVTVYKYDCDYQPEGFQSVNEWLAACPTQGNGHTFTLTDSEAASEQMETSGGSATWTGVPEGNFTLTETLQPGWGEPVIWCGWAAVTEINGVPASVHAPAENFPAPGGVHNGSIPYPGTTYICYWFNIPVDYSSVTVYKYNCPEGYLEGVVEDPLMAYQDMCTTPGNGIDFTLEYGEYSSTKPIMGGTATWTDVPVGNFTITETIPPGYDSPLWWCGPAGSLNEVDAPEGVHTGAIDSEQMRYVCWVFNFPNPDRTVTVYKWLCPEGYETFEGTYEEWSTNCTMPMDGVNFTFSDTNGNWPLPTFGGQATWYAAAQGEVSLDEHIPPGYFEPVVYCSLEMVNGAAAFEDFTEYPATDGMISRTIDASEYEWICHFFNIPKGPGEITIYKWLCPPGYDFHAWGADPKTDCTEAWDGVTFTLDQPVGPNLMTNTGDSVPGAVYFGGLDPGDYVITETVPAGIEYVFVLDCTGTDVDKVHPYPLQWGNTLQLKVAGGDSIVCNWYNVPPPDNGWVTVYKYSCWTPTFTKEVDCEIYEHGATFELFGVPSNTSYGVGTTDVGGLYTWNGLEEGAYTIEEISHKPCKITSTKVDGMGNAWVDDGQGTIIKVYNCKSSTTTTPTTPGTTPVPKVPGKVPGKYPNTGADPAASDGVMPMIQQTPESTQTVEELDELADDYYRISCLEGTPGATVAATTAPAEGTPAATATEEVFDLPIDGEDASTPAAGGTPGAEEACARGALPERVVVDAANVNAEVETLEIVDGLMQQPTGPQLVSWYKETGRLGENNNVVIAGHLNYVNVPEGVFFYLDQLEEGDRVEITGDDGMTYIYEVQWVRQESNLEPPAADVIGPTDVPSLTLITCGGPWNAGIAEYEERTVARAVQVDVVAAEDSGDEAAFSPLLAA